MVDDEATVRHEGVVAGLAVQDLHYLAMDLSVVEGPDTGLVVRLGPGRTRVGSAEGCGVRLTDRTVSRVHCELELERGGVRAVDPGSTNGTFVDGVRVRDADLRAGSILRVGATSLRLTGTDEPLVVPLSRKEAFGELLGKSPAMRRTYAILERAAASHVTVLVQGETGTGKEVVARALHRGSPRASGPFVAIDCGAMAETLIESELFGHTRGAFSGAVAERRGLFEEADGGTLFLDEIGELPAQLQPKLLRVLETREVRRLGANTSRRVDVRVVAATNRPLAQAVNEGAFRSDLFYRLAVVEIALPPLRARIEDVPLLAQHFFRRLGGGDALPAGLVTALAGRSWPGNVRELRNFVERWISLAPPSPSVDGATATLELDPKALLALDLPLKEARSLWNQRFERLYVEALLARTGGNVRKAAEVAEVNRRWIQRLLAQVRGDSLDDGDE